MLYSLELPCSREELVKSLDVMMKILEQIDAAPVGDYRPERYDNGLYAFTKDKQNYISATSANRYLNLPKDRMVSITLEMAGVKAYGNGKSNFHYYDRDDLARYWASTN